MPIHCAGRMGQVRFVQRAAVEQQLAAGNLVLLTNVGVSSSGELLNCNAFDVSSCIVGVCGVFFQVWDVGVSSSGELPDCNTFDVGLANCCCERALHCHPPASLLSQLPYMSR